MEFARAGFPVQPPIVSDVEVGIQRVYGLLAREELIIFNDLSGLLDDILTYSRSVDESGEPTEDIENQHIYHHIDALRYLAVYLDRRHGGGWKLERY